LSSTPDRRFPVALPVLRWGRPDAERSVLLLHGVTSAGGVWWRIASALAAAGWTAVAPDLRGHGAAPRTDSYALEDFRTDVLEVRPPGGGPWDLVVGHSLGGAVTVLAAAADPRWTRSALLLDPVITLPAAGRDALLAVLLGELTATDPAAYRTSHPRWHAEDVHQKILAARAVSEHTVREIITADEWAVGDAAAGLRVPVRLLGADPRTGALLGPAEGASLCAANPLLSYAAVEGAGHSVQRDDPDRVVAEARALVASLTE